MRSKGFGWIIAWVLYCQIVYLYNILFILISIVCTLLLYTINHYLLNSQHACMSSTLQNLFIYIRTKLSSRINKVITLTKYRKFLVTLKLIEQQDNKIWMPQNKLFCYWNWILLLLLVQFSFRADWSENLLYVGVKEIVCIF